METLDGFVSSQTAATPKSPTAPLFRSHRRTAPSPFERTVLVLQGGGALGSYQAGAYEALAEASLHPDWVAGVSIGAINAALIVGNRPEDRVAKMRQFWEEVSIQPGSLGCFEELAGGAQADAGHAFLNQLSAWTSLLLGVPGLYEPRLLPPWMQLPGGEGATSFYDTSPLKKTLERLIDFERINAGPARLSLGAVNVRTGNFAYFDTTSDRIGPEHVLASAALPPGFPAIDVDGEFYWDGGLVSNTPLQWVVDSLPHWDSLVFQVDLWSARGEPPKDLAEVVTRQKEIQFSSRTRAATDQFKRTQQLRTKIADLLAALPPACRQLEEARALEREADRKTFNIIQLIYHATRVESSVKDFEFSRLSMTEHWATGYHDAVRTLRHPEVFERLGPGSIDGVFTFDVAVDGRV